MKPLLDARPTTIWLTGLSGAGKSTIGSALIEELRERGMPAVLLDGDDIRANLTRELGFSREDRDQQVTRVGWLCELLNRHGISAVAALVSPYREARGLVRTRIGRFIEVYVTAPMHVLEARDPKGYYRRTRDGRMEGLTGVGAPYEVPEDADVVCLNDGPNGVAGCVAAILAKLDLEVVPS